MSKFIIYDKFILDQMHNGKYWKDYVLYVEGKIIFMGANWFKGKGNGRGSYGDEGGERTTLLAADPIILLSFSHFSNIFSRFGEIIDPKKTMLM